MNFLTSIMAILLISAPAVSDTIKFPDEELATETVLPVFDKRVVVKNPNVTVSGRFDIGPLLGMNMLEPFYSPITYGANASYHFNEEQGVQLFGVMFPQELSNYAKQIDGNSSTAVNFNFSPKPKYMGLINYQWSPYYGKMSITKETVMNLQLFGLIGAGVINVNDAMKPVIDFGLGQSFYMGKNFALRLDLMFYLYRGPGALSDGTGVNSASSTYGDRMNTGSIISLSSIFLLPTM